MSDTTLPSEQNSSLYLPRLIVPLTGWPPRGVEAARCGRCTSINGRGGRPPGIRADLDGLSCRHSKWLKRRPSLSLPATPCRLLVFEHAFVDDGDQRQRLIGRSLEALLHDLETLRIVPVEPGVRSYLAR